jgi:deoxyribonuclease V
MLLRSAQGDSLDEQGGGVVSAPSPHSWAVTPKEAMAIQDALRARVETTDRLPVIRHVAGVDVGFEEGGG